MPSPLVSIGMPVYNGGEDLRQTLDSLLAQKYSHFELIISDNASTDVATKSITEEYARRDSRIRLTRQTVNQGALANFVWVVNQAHGEFFMWAAHDDAWSDNYVASLVTRLSETPDAVLATPLTRVETTTLNGSKREELIPPAPNADCPATLDFFIRKMAFVWFYGLYRTEWLKTAAPEMLRYPLLYGDIIWVYGLLLNQRVVGDPEATFYYTAVQGKRRELTPALKMKLWAVVLCETIRLTWSRVPSGQRLSGLRRACGFYYRHHVRRGNPVATAVRILKMSLMWIWIGLTSLLHAIQRHLASTNQPTSGGPIQTDASTPLAVPAPRKLEERHAA